MSVHLGNTRTAFTCARCGSEFWRKSKPRDARRYCSRACAFADIITWSRLHVGPWVARFRAPLVHRCKVCRVVFWGRTRSENLCGPVCRRRFACLDSRERNIAAVGVKSERACRECGINFTPAYGFKRRVFCSQACLDRCTKRAAKAQRRARWRSVPRESFDPREIFKRDHWRCQLCHGPLHRRQKTPHPKAATLDHVVPLSAGGSHVRANVQAAHFACNVRKGAAVSCGSQLRLA